MPFKLKIVTLAYTNKIDGETVLCEIVIQIKYNFAEKIEQLPW